MILLILKKYRYFKTAQQLKSIDALILSSIDTWKVSTFLNYQYISSRYQYFQVSKVSILLKYHKYLYFSIIKSINIFQVTKYRYLSSISTFQVSILLQVSIIFKNHILIIWIHKKYWYLRSIDTLIHKKYRYYDTWESKDTWKLIMPLKYWYLWYLKSTDISKQSKTWKLLTHWYFLSIDTWKYRYF